MNKRVRIVIGVMIILLFAGVSYFAYSRSKSDKDYNIYSPAVEDDIVNKEYTEEELEEIEKEYEDNFEPNIIIDE